jgi:sterol desaturase/sphingolipid hydroxylase (fatty acid hydroxylase superfamily)
LVPPTKSYDPFLWAAHIVHHSSDNFNLGTAVRNGWFTIFYKPLYVWIVIIGFPPEMLVVCMGIEALWQFQLHTYVKKLGFIEKFLNTHTASSTHRILNIWIKPWWYYLMFLIEFFGNS